VFAYGESAGGLLAARLAQEAHVEAAAIQSPVANLPFFLSLLGDSLPERLGVPTLIDEQRYSPASHGAANRIFATAAADGDPLTPSTLAWASKERLVSAITVPGDHLDSTGTLYPSRVRLLIRWLARRAAHPRPRRRSRHDRAQLVDQAGSSTITGISRSVRRW
jgi:hypothetical protein